MMDIFGSLVSETGKIYVIRRKYFSEIQSAVLTKTGFVLKQNAQATLGDHEKRGDGGWQYIPIDSGSYEEYVSMDANIL